MQTSSEPAKNGPPSMTDSEEPMTETKVLDMIARIEAPATLTAAPIIDAKGMAEAIRSYKELQDQLDAAMPDSTMELQGKLFRKKSYWRGVATAFGLSVSIVKEEIVKIPNMDPAFPAEDWGYLITCEASSPDGKSSQGDGSCMWSDKAVFQSEWVDRKKKLILDEDGNAQIDWPATRANATMHNIRGHALTRAKNRAISDLVGFGEVSVEELPESAFQGGGERKPAARKTKATTKAATKPKGTTEPVKRAETDSNAVGDPKKDQEQVLGTSDLATNPETGAMLQSLEGATYEDWDGWDDPERKSNGAVSSKQVAFILTKGERAGLDLPGIIRVVRKKHSDVYHLWQLSKRSAGALIDGLIAMASKKA